MVSNINSRNIRALVQPNTHWLHYSSHTQQQQHQQLQPLHFSSSNNTIEFYANGTNNATTSTVDGNIMLAGTAIDMLSAFAAHYSTNNHSSVTFFMSVADDDDSRSAQAGQRDPHTGLWNGTHGQLQHGSVDILLNNFIVSPERLLDFSFGPVIDFDQMYAVKSSLYYSTNDARHRASPSDTYDNKMKLLQMFAPLSYKTWLTLLGALCVYIFFGGVFEYFRPIPVNSQSEKTLTRRHRVVLVSYITGLLDTLVNQGNIDSRHAITEHVALKCLLLCWAIICLLLINVVYPAQLITSFTVKSPAVLPFSNFKTLYEAEYRIILGRNDFTAQLPQQLQLLRPPECSDMDANDKKAQEVEADENMEAFYKALLPQDQWASTYGGLFDAIRSDPKLVTFLPLSFIESAQTRWCDLQALPLRQYSSPTTPAVNELPLVHISFMLRRDDWQLKRFVDEHFERLRETGLLRAWNERAQLWQNTRDNAASANCDARASYHHPQHDHHLAGSGNDDGRQRLRLVQLASPFAFTAIGFGCALLVAVLEWWLFYWAKRH